MQTYEELVTLGDVWQWDPDGMQLAKAERFNQNVQACINAAIQALAEAKGYADSLNTDKAVSATSLSGYGILDAFTKDEVTAAISNAIDALVGLAPSELDTLKEIADKITLSDSDIQGIMSALSTKAALSQVYERTVIDTKLADKADKATTLGGYGITDAYTKTQSDAAMALKADQATTYTKTQSDAAMALKANVADTYTKTQADTLLSAKAASTNVYTKTETDSRIQAVVGAAPSALDTLQEIAAQLQNDETAATALAGVVATKANAADVYTKTQVDALFSAYGDADVSAII